MDTWKLTPLFYLLIAESINQVFLERLARRPKINRGSAQFVVMWTLYKLLKYESRKLSVVKKPSWGKALKQTYVLDTHYGALLSVWKYENMMIDQQEHKFSRHNYDYQFSKHTSNDKTPSPKLQNYLSHRKKTRIKGVETDIQFVDGLALELKFKAAP